MHSKKFKVSTFRISKIPRFPHFKCPNSQFPQILFLANAPWICSWTVKSNLVYPNPQIRVPRGPKNPEIMNINVFGLSHNQIEELLVQIEAE